MKNSYVKINKVINIHFLFVFFSVLFVSPVLTAQITNPYDSSQYWSISGSSIVWDLKEEIRLPHSDNIEMAGRKVAAIIYYNVDKQRVLHVNRDVIFPQMRTYLRTNQASWKRYRAYLRFNYSDDFLPVIENNEKVIVPGVVDSIKIEGKIVFYHHPVRNIRIIRTLFPSMTKRLFIEKWELLNTGDTLIKLYIGNTVFKQDEKGVKGIYKRKVFSDADSVVNIKPGETYRFAVYFAGAINNEQVDVFSFTKEEKRRDEFLNYIKNNFIVETSDAVLNTLFYFSKIRASENLFDTKMGVVHSPGGGNYYAGIWANDQAEYSSPFFPFLGYKLGDSAAINCYNWFLKHKPKDFSPITSSFEMEGDLTCCGLDRGDAAMIAYGGSQFLLFYGNKTIAGKLWPLIEWCLDYNEKNLNEFGVVKSETDEMEGRISTGTANLATSSLYYGALKNAVHLARELGKHKLSQIYEKRTRKLKDNIEKYFGATIDSIETYRYFRENEHLRHWICLPLVVDINERKNGTVNALLNKLWTENGVLVEYNPENKKEKVFWDRGTLYALRGTFKAGASDISLSKLDDFSKKRLLGNHVPYVIEAFPENNMRHLSAESALYCRIFSEGIIGIEPTGFNSFTISPNLPSEWNFFNINKMHIFNTEISIHIKRINNKLKLEVYEKEKPIVNKTINNGELIRVKL
jgi:hypothetical protein